MRSSLYAGGSWAILTVGLLVPVVLGASPSIVLFTSALIVGLQAAQSSVVQVAPRWASNRLSSIVCAALAVASSATAALVSSFWLPIFATLAGALLGLPMGAAASDLLQVRGGLAYQRFQFARSVLIVASVFTTSIIPTAPLFAMSLTPLLIGGAASLVTTTSNRPSTHLSAGGGTHPLWVLFGLSLSLFYRNDVNWLRSSLSASPDFQLWHVSLVGYTGVQGLIGFVVVQRFFANRQQAAARSRDFARQNPLLLAGLWVGLGAIAVFAAMYALVPVVVGVAAILAVVIGVASGAAHVQGASWVPYSAGTIGTLALVALIAVEVDPSLALVIENVVVGSILLVILLLKARRK